MTRSDKWLIAVTILAVIALALIGAAIGPEKKPAPVQDSPRTVPSAASRSLQRLPWPLSAPPSPALATEPSSPSADPPFSQEMDSGRQSESPRSGTQSSAEPVVEANTTEETAGNGAGVDIGEGVTPAPKTFARSLVPAAQWSCLRKLWQRESGWQPTADNPTSTAFGIAQMLTETSADPHVQILDGLAYIRSRYDTSCTAWAHWQRHGWY